MNWRVSAGPQIDLPLFQLTGPVMWQLRRPIWARVELAAAAPTALMPSIRAAEGRVIFAISGISKLQRDVFLPARHRASFEPGDRQVGGLVRVFCGQGFVDIDAVARCFVG